MTTEEFSNEFDVLVSSYRRFRDFDHREPIDTIEFDEYEKSFFLTEAQEQIVRELYHGNVEGYGPFETDEMTRRMLDSLVKTIELTNSDKYTNTTEGIKKLTTDSILYKLPTDVMAITVERIEVTSSLPGCEGTKHWVDVIPVKQDEFLRMMRNPFKSFNKRRAFRLDAGVSNEMPIVELVSKYSSTPYTIKYYVRYLKRPEAIILENLVNLKINNSNIKATCLLSPELHRIILRRAVQLALATKPTARG